MAKEIGVMTAVLIDGNDATRVLNSLRVMSDTDGVMNTRFRAPGYAQEFIAGLTRKGLDLGGFSPIVNDVVLALMEQSVGTNRTGQEVMAGIGGLSPGLMALWLKSLQTTSASPIGVDSVTSTSAAFVAATGGMQVGVCLLGIHGNDSAAANEVQSLTITALADAPVLSIGDGDGGTANLAALFTSAGGTTVTATQLKNALEALPAIGLNNLSVSGSATFATTWSGTFTLVFQNAKAGLRAPLLTSNNAAVVVAEITQGANRYAVITAIGNGVTVQDSAAATSHGGEAALQVISAVGSGKTLTVIVQHAPDVSGSPGTFVDLVTFTAATSARNVQRVRVADGTTVFPYLRARVSGVTGSFVAAVAFARYDG